ncbi:MAG: restriction endonuclease [Patescibacteria group bacterium UBA2163]
MIFFEPIKDWLDLEMKVSQVFLDIGYETEHSKNLQTVRGPVQVDVCATDISSEPNTIYICECKNWQRPVSRSVVADLRTVIHDVGVNFGIIISSQGFQPGAIASAQNTNIYLYTWEQFQQTYAHRWFKFKTKSLHDNFRLLLDCTEMIVGVNLGRLLDQLDQNKMQKFMNLREKYSQVGLTILYAGSQAPVGDFLDRYPNPTQNPIPYLNKSFSAYGDFLENILRDATQAQEEFLNILR